MQELGGERRWLSGWGRYPVQACRLLRPTCLQSAQAVVSQSGTDQYIARGLGRSYGDAALNEDHTVLEMTRCDRILALDGEKATIQCEAGASLASILHVAIRHGLFLPTTPGTKHVTLGGAIAADVHGKNHHRDGSLGNHVLNLRLLTATGQIHQLSPTEQPDLFWATVGGMGLTGVILSAQLQLIRISSSYLCAKYQPTFCLDETLERLEETERAFQYSVAWLDGTARCRSLGRGIVMLANHTAHDDLPPGLRCTPLKIGQVAEGRLPVALLRWMLNRWTARAFNNYYWRRQRQREQLVSYEPFFYPLDRLSQWNRLYGHGGFVQYQALFPRAHARQGLLELLETVAQSKQTPYLAVLKSSGASTLGYLSYLFPGYTLALDLPNTGEPLRKLTRQLDQILLKYGGRIYLAKDAMATGETIRAMYPRLAEFQQVKRQVDPHQRFSSSLARRLGLVEAA